MSQAAAVIALDDHRGRAIEAGEVQAAIIGSGFAGLAMAIGLKRKGIDDFVVLERAADVGRTWRDNTYPGWMTGPNTGIGHTSLVYMIESQVPYVLGALDIMALYGVGAVEVRSEPLAAFNQDVQARMCASVWTMSGCASWYLDRHGRNATLWPDFTWRYRRLTRRFDAESYALSAERHGLAPAAAGPTPPASAAVA